MRHTFTEQIVKIQDKGMAAFEAGKTLLDCPYKFKRTGFGRIYFDAWNRGFWLATEIASDQRLFDKARAEGRPSKKDENSSCV
jgi:hypothetical protein